MFVINSMPMSTAKMPPAIPEPVQVKTIPLAAVMKCVSQCIIPPLAAFLYLLVEVLRFSLLMNHCFRRICRSGIVRVVPAAGVRHEHEVWSDKFLDDPCYNACENEPRGQWTAVS